MYGEAGSDQLFGGLGADQLIGGDGVGEFDYARYDDANYGNLTIRLDAPNLNTGAALGDTYIGIEGLIGGVGNDFISGNGSVNVLYGAAGNDRIYGRAGADELYGEEGSDRLYGGTGADVHVGGDDAGIDLACYDDANYGNLTLRLDGLANVGVAAVGDSYFGIEGLVGGLGNDTLIGNSLGNQLYGGGGDDLIDGLAGKDRLTGGSGADRFSFSATLNATTNVDAIVDFVHGIDDLQLKQSIFGSILATLDADEFCIGTAAADGNDFIIYNDVTGRLYYDANGNLAGGQTLFATVTIGTVLDIGDFVMV